jgi:hypothetical protein
MILLHRPKAPQLAIAFRHVFFTNYLYLPYVLFMHSLYVYSRHPFARIVIDACLFPAYNDFHVSPGAPELLSPRTAAGD